MILSPGRTKQPHYNRLLLKYWLNNLYFTLIIKVEWTLPQDGRDQGALLK